MKLLSGLVATAATAALVFTPLPAEAKPRIRPAASTAGPVCQGKAISLAYKLDNRRSNRRVVFNIRTEVDGRVKQRQRSLGPGRVANRTVSLTHPSAGKVRVRAAGRELLREKVSRMACRNPQVVLGVHKCRRGVPSQKVYLDSREGTLRAKYYVRLISPNRPPHYVNQTVWVAAGEFERIWLNVDSIHDAMYVAVNGQGFMTHHWGEATIPRC